MFLLCGAALSALTVHAQKKVIIEDESPKGVVLVTIDKAGDEIIRIMNESQMPYIHEPQAPRFLLTDRKGSSPWASAAMYAPRQSTTSAASSTTSTLSPPTSQTGAKSETSFKWMPARPPFS